MTSWDGAENRLRNLSRTLLLRQDEERRKLAGKLHDSAAQNLVAASLTMARLETPGFQLAQEAHAVMGQARLLIDQTLQEIRSLCNVLYPPLLDEAGLVPALSWYAQCYERASGIKIELGLPKNAGRLLPQVERGLFRIVEESLTNVRKHSNSRTARISLEKNPSELLLTIADQGCGIPLRILKSIKIGALAGIGIAGMVERAEQLGGTLDIVSGKRGTSLRVVIPLPGDKS